MAQAYFKQINKQQKHPKVHYQEYIYTPDDPQSHVSHDSLQGLDAELEAQLSQDIETMRKSFRYFTRRMRSE